MGRRNKDTADQRFEMKVDKTPGYGPDGECWIWTGARKNKVSYGFLGPSSGRQRLAHRFSYERAYGPIPDGMCVLHSCDMPSCVNPKHLSIGTQADNIRDCRAKGRFVDPLKFSGELSCKAKLKTEQVVQIRNDWASGKSRAAQLAREFGVAPDTIADILKRRTWKHVT